MQKKYRKEKRNTKGKKQTGCDPKTFFEKNKVDATEINKRKVNKKKDK